ncbi:uncharacterized protein LOC143028973 [Oratosquilla oratoria]|uniref:uncharacterized protein LOC143028973 n=1 Tax=Oratosquilla oratoria TaxID=337810 RepID=UPI003F7634A8
MSYLSYQHCDQDPKCRNVKVNRAPFVLASFLLPLCHSFSITRLTPSSSKSEDSTDTPFSSYSTYSSTSSIYRAPLVKVLKTQHLRNKEPRHLDSRIKPFRLVTSFVDAPFKPSVQLSQGNVNYITSPGQSSYSIFLPSSWPVSLPKASLKTSDGHSLAHPQLILPISSLVQESPRAFVDATTTPEPDAFGFPPSIQENFGNTKTSSSGGDESLAISGLTAGFVDVTGTGS